MRNKRFLTILLSSIFIVSMIGCSKSQSVIDSNSNNKETVSLKLWGPAEDSQLLSEIVENFKSEYSNEANFDITIEDQGEDTAKGRILSDIHNVADVFAFADDQISVLSAAGILEPIDSDEVKEANVNGAVEAASINDKLYAYPMTADNGYFLYYNKQFLSEADVQSLDRILSVAGQNNKKFAMDLTSGWYLYSFFGNTGLKMGLNEDGVTNYCNWNTSEGQVSGLDVAKYMNSMASNPGFINTGDDGLVDGLKDGSIIAGVSGVWLGSKVQEILGNNYGAAKLPAYNCGGKEIQMASFTGYKMIGVNSYSQNKEWAMKLGSWITSENNQILRFKKRGQGPSNINAANSDEIKKSPAINAILKQSEFGHLQRVGVNFWGPVRDFGNKIMAGNMSDGEIQNLLNTTVNGITASIIKE